MTAYNVIDRTLLATGQPEDITRVLANLDAIAAVLNGNIDSSNISSVAPSKLTGYPSDGTKVLKGDASWGTISTLLTLVCDLKLGADQASFDTNTILGGNIPGNSGDDLVIRLEGRGAGACTYPLCRMNNDSGANYDYEILAGNAAATSAEGANAATALRLGYMPPSTEAASRFGAYDILVPNYADTDHFKDVSVKAYTNNGGQRYALATGGMWLSTAAITRLTFLPDVGNWKQGSRLTIWRRAIA